jgi:hypothetical protein
MGATRMGSVKNDARNRAVRFRNVLSIISDAINRRDRSKDNADTLKSAFGAGRD